MRDWRDYLKPLKERAKDLVARPSFKPTIMSFAGVIFVAFITASVASSFSVSLILRLFDGTSRPRLTVPAGDIKAPDLANYHLIKKGILQRNIFNATGEYPPEAEKSKDSAAAQNFFDVTAACNPCSLKVSLLGTIAMGDTSVGIIKEQGFEDADIYKVGDYLIGSETAQIVGILQNEVIINNAGRKECLFALGSEVKKGIDAGRAGTGSGAAGASDGGQVTLQASWVESELGEGFSKILQSARLVPNTEGNKVKGFKIFAIQKESLFDKVGLRDGDIVIQVNETVMEAEQGFALYQTFLEEKEIVIQTLRDGKTPTTLKVRIK